jgi:hypothetical protein
MPSRHGFVVFVVIGLVFGGPPRAWAQAQMDAAPALTASPPQQMPFSGTPGVYPSTQYPATAAGAFPSTSYPTTAQASGTLGDQLSPGVNDRDPIYKPYGSPDAMTASLSPARDSQGERLLTSNETWEWQLLPTGLMYKSYLAGNREPRLGTQLVQLRDHGWIWDASVGGRVGILRYGTANDLWPQGWQLDIEGAAFPRLDLEHEEDLISADFRAGLLATTRQGPWEAKFGYYHLSSHLGDEFMIRFPSTLATRINYSRETLVAGFAVYPHPSLRLYSEVGWAFHEDGGAKPWEFQFGADFSSTEPTGICGAPFFAINAHLRQENDFGGNMTVQTGWQWRGRTGHLLRTGMQYFNGMSEQYQFFNTFEEQIGFGLWYDY